MKKSTQSLILGTEKGGNELKMRHRMEKSTQSLILGMGKGEYFAVVRKYLIISVLDYRTPFIKREFTSLNS